MYSAVDIYVARCTIIDKAVVMGRYAILVLVLGAGVAFIGAPVLAQQSPSHGLIDNGTTWRYIDDGSNQGTIWRRLSFDDSQWKEGLSEFGFGDGGETTLLSPGSDDNRTITYYFRTTIVVDNSDLDGYHHAQIDLRADDGAAVYINGQLAVLSRMREGAAFDELATEPTIDESVFDVYQVPLSMLHPGKNVIAAEVHQISLDSSDASFDLRMRSMRRLYNAPVVIGPSIPGALHPLSSGNRQATAALMTSINTYPTRLIVGTPSGPKVQLLSLGGKFMDAEDIDANGSFEVLFKDPLHDDPANANLMLLTDLGRASPAIVISSEAGYVKTGCFADIDEDGMQDIAWTAPPGIVKWRRHLGDLEFGPEEMLFGLDGEIAVGLTNGDFNGDGRQEFLIDLQTGASVAVRAIDGSWNPPANLPNFDFEVINDLAQIADINGDRKDDVLMQAGFNTGTSLGRLAQTKTAENASRIPVYFQANDIDSDGDLDLLSWQSDQKKMFWHLNNGRGLFPQTDDLTIAELTASAAVVMDADLDGLDDLIVNTREALLFLRGIPKGSPIVSQLDAEHSALEAPGMVRLDWSVLGTKDVAILPLPGIVAATGSTTINITETTRFQLLGAETIVRVNAFRKAHEGQTFPMPPLEAPSPYPIDIDGDGQEELLWTSGTVQESNRQLFALTPNLNGVMDARPLLLWPDGALAPSTAQLAQIDSDGIPDLLLGNGSSFWWSKGQPNGAFAPPARFVEESIRAQDNADMDGDGDVDAVLVTDRLLLRENEDGVLSSARPIGDIPSPESDPVKLITLDADQDGDNDIVFATADGIELITLQSGQVVDHRWLITLPSNSFELLSSDIDDDGWPDLVFAFDRNPTIHAFLSTTPEGGVSAGHNQLLGEFAGTFTPGIAAADINGDGRTDIFSTHTSIWLRNMGDGHFVSELPVPAHHQGSPGAHIFVDADRDGDRDYLSYRQGNLAPFWMENLISESRPPQPDIPFRITAVTITVSAILIEWSSPIATAFAIEESSDTTNWLPVVPGELPTDIGSHHFRATVPVNRQTEHFRYFRIRKN